MIDHIVGTPSPSWKRTQVSLLHISSRESPIVLLPGFSCYLFLAMANYMGRRAGSAYSLDPSVEQETWYGASPDTSSFQPFIPFLGDFTPWQIVVSTLTAVYAMRNADKLIGLGGKFSLPIRKPREAQYPLRFG